MQNIDKKKEDIASMSVEERQELLQYVNVKLSHLLRQKLVFAVLLLIGCKLFIYAYLKFGFNIICVLQGILLLGASLLFRHAYRMDRLMKKIKNTIIEVEQSETDA